MENGLRSRIFPPSEIGSVTGRKVGDDTVVWVPDDSERKRGRLVSEPERGGAAG